MQRTRKVWNVYEVPISGDRIRTRLMIIDVYLVPNRFDIFGYPVLIIQSGAMNNIERGNVARV